jgi:hypothetical protein
MEPEQRLVQFAGPRVFALLVAAGTIVANGIGVGIEGANAVSLGRASLPIISSLLILLESWSNPPWLVLLRRPLVWIALVVLFGASFFSAR